MPQPEWGKWGQSAYCPKCGEYDGAWNDLVIACAEDGDHTTPITCVCGHEFEARCSIQIEFSTRSEEKCQ